MRKLHITESQYNYIQSVNEVQNQGAGVEVAAKKDANGFVTQQTLDAQNRELDTQGLNNAQIVVDQDTLREEEEDINKDYNVFTKKQLKEARRNKLVAESKKFTKKELRESYEEHYGLGYNTDAEQIMDGNPKPDEDETFLMNVWSKLEDLWYRCDKNFAACSMQESNANYWRKVQNEVKEYIPTDRTGYAEEIVKFIDEMLSQIQIY